MKISVILFSIFSANIVLASSLTVDNSVTCTTICSAPTYDQGRDAYRTETTTALESSLQAAQAKTPVGCTVTCEPTLQYMIRKLSQIK